MVPLLAQHLRLPLNTLILMDLTFARVSVGVAWVALMGLGGDLAGAASVLHWVVLGSIAVIPPALARTLCRASDATLSPRRHEVRR